jgi:dGTPase
MNWLQLLSQQTLTDDKGNLVRTAFDRDFDRIIFSHPFRRLQDKTQVHPLPEQDFVHTRLTHSLEVSSVGRSLGRAVGEALVNRHKELAGLVDANDIGAIVAAASLAHDIGNPPFGHSGEASISSYFLERADLYKTQFSEIEWSDLIQFEGNAQGYRLLNKPGYQGLKLTAPTLAAFTKYPRPSKIAQRDKKRKSQKKFGFYHSEHDIFKDMAEGLGLVSVGENQWCRHPLAFLVEAADDICYHIIDLEDGCNLGLVSHEQTIALYAAIIGDKFKPEKLAKIPSKKEQIGVLRAMSISHLIQECVDMFLENEDALLSGDFDKSLADEIASKDALNEIITVSIQKIYRSQTVLETEAAGYQILSGLLDTFIPCGMATYAGEVSQRDKTFYRLLPEEVQGEIKTANSSYQACRALLDFVAGMTDSSAIHLYRKVKGIALPGVR